MDKPTLDHQCAGGCGSLVFEAGDDCLAFCPTCWYLSKTCVLEDAADARELARRRHDRDALLAEIARALRYAYPDRGEQLLAAVEKRLT